jgi:DNA-binding NarL/FixJ family response regulator
VIRLLVVDDHQIVRAGLVAMLSRNPGLEVVGEAADGLEAVEQVGKRRPDVVLMDMQMPRLNGVEAIRRIKAVHPEVQVIVLTTYDDDELIWSGIQAGAKGYLLKDAPLEDLFRAIHAVAAGQSLLQPAVAAKLMERISSGPHSGIKGAPRSGELAEPLSDREAEILRLMARGAANKEIAGLLFISENTVKTHIGHIFQKLGVGDRTEAVTKALRLNLITLDHPNG